MSRTLNRRLQHLELQDQPKSIHVVHLQLGQGEDEALEAYETTSPVRPDDLVVFLRKFD